MQYIYLDVTKENIHKFRIQYSDKQYVPCYYNKELSKIFDMDGQVMIKLSQDQRQSQQLIPRMLGDVFFTKVQSQQQNSKQFRRTLKTNCPLFLQSVFEADLYLGEYILQNNNTRLVISNNVYLTNNIQQILLNRKQTTIICQNTVPKSYMRMLFHFQLLDDNISQQLKNLDLLLQNNSSLMQFLQFISYKFYQHNSNNYIQLCIDEKTADAQNNEYDANQQLLFKQFIHLLQQFNKQQNNGKINQQELFLEIQNITSQKALDSIQLNDIDQQTIFYFSCETETEKRYLSRDALNMHTNVQNGVISSLTNNSLLHQFVSALFFDIFQRYDLLEIDSQEIQQQIGFQVGKYFFVRKTVEAQQQSQLFKIQGINLKQFDGEKQKGQSINMGYKQISSQKVQYLQEIEDEKLFQKKQTQIQQKEKGDSFLQFIVPKYSIQTVEQVNYKLLEQQKTVFQNSVLLSTNFSDQLQKNELQNNKTEKSQIMDINKEINYTIINVDNYYNENQYVDIEIEVQEENI